MSTKDKRILNPDGGRYPFKVSDEYFDNLTARIMERIPEETEAEQASNAPKQEEKRAQIISIRQHRRRNLWISTISIAASFLLIATIALKFIPNPSTSTEQTKELTAEYTDKDGDDALDLFGDNYNADLMTYTMVNQMDVYYYLSSGDMDE